MFHYSCAFFIFQIEVPLKIFTKGWPLLRQLGKNFELKSLNLLYFFINDTQKKPALCVKELVCIRNAIFACCKRQYIHQFISVGRKIHKKVFPLKEF